MNGKYGIKTIKTIGPIFGTHFGRKSLLHSAADRSYCRTIVPLYLRISGKLFGYDFPNYAWMTFSPEDFKSQIKIFF